MVALVVPGLALGAVPEQQAVTRVRSQEAGEDLAYDLQVLGNYVFLANWNEGVKVIEIDKSNPLKPTPKLVETFSTNGSALNAHLVDDNIYVINHDTTGLQIFRTLFDFKPASSPVQVDYNY